MKDFDLTKIGKEMPYKAPDKDFFENFTEELLNKVATKQQPTKVFSLKRVLTPVIGIAAALAIILTVGFNLESQSERVDLMLSENINDSLDSYFASLSDEELSYLAIDSSYQDDFYENLPTD